MCMCVQCLWRLEEGIRALETEVTGSCTTPKQILGTRLNMRKPKFRSLEPTACWVCSPLALCKNVRRQENAWKVRGQICRGK